MDPHFLKVREAGILRTNEYSIENVIISLHKIFVISFIPLIYLYFMNPNQNKHSRDEELFFFFIRERL